MDLLLIAVVVVIAMFGAIYAIDALILRRRSAKLARDLYEGDLSLIEREAGDAPLTSLGSTRLHRVGRDDTDRQRTR